MTSYGEQILMANAEIVSEGAVSGEGEEATFSGSTMITIDLEPLGLTVSRRRKEADQVLGAIRSSIGVHVRLMRIAREEAERLTAPLLPSDLLTELEFRIVEHALLVDIDLECGLGRQGEDLLELGESLR